MVRSVITATLAALSAATAMRIHAARPALSVVDLLEAYDRADYGVVVAGLDRRAADLARDGHLQNNGDVADFDLNARPWIAAGGPQQSAHRRLVAATVALEAAHARRSEAPAPSPPFAIWACALMREDPPTEGTNAERLWYIASVSALEDLGAWHILLPVVLSEARRRQMWPLEADEGIAGHLAHAIARFPDDPRLRLAQVEAEDSLTEGHSLMTQGLRFIEPDVDSHLQLRSDEVSQKTLAELRSRSDTPRALARRPAATILSHLDSLPEIANGYLALEGYGDLRAEMEVRFAYAEGRLSQWKVASAHLERVPDLTHDSLIVYWSDYVRGWVLQHEGEPDAAIAAYREALALVPNVPSATALLADRLFLTDRSSDRLEAYRLLDAVYRMDPVPVDPWLLYWKGDGRLWPERIKQLREVLK